MKVEIILFGCKDLLEQLMTPDSTNSITPSENISVCIPKSCLSCRELKIASGIAPVPAMLKAGVRVGLGTDGASSNNNLDLLEEARLAAFLHKLANNDPTVIPAGQALSMATLGGAKAMGMDSDIGSLELGKKADIILLDVNKPHMYPKHDLTSHVIYSARSSDVTTVIINGKPVMEDGVLTDIDEEEVLRTAEERAKALVAKA